MPTPSSLARAGIVSRFSRASRMCDSRVSSHWLMARSSPSVQPSGFEPTHPDRKLLVVRAVSVGLYFSTAQEVVHHLVEGGGVLDHGPVPGLTEDVHLHVGQPL